MTIFRRLSAYVRIKKCVCGVTVLTYGGPMHNRDIEALRDQALGVCAGSESLLLDMRGVVPLSEFGPYVDEATYEEGAPAGAVISPESHKEVWWRYAAKLAAHGIPRAVFTSELEARAWARARLPVRPRA